MVVDDMIRQLVDGQEALVRTSWDVFPTAEKALSQLTNDLRTMRMQVYEKAAWMIRSLPE
jgi:starvation-inducible DNA-binding protein